MRKIKVNAYEFPELSDKAKDKVVDMLANYDEASQCVIEDATNIGVDLRFDSCAIVELTDTPFFVSEKIIKEHGETCETYQLALSFTKKWSDLVAKYSDGINKGRVTEENEEKFDCEADNMEEQFKRDLTKIYDKMLRKEQCYITSYEYTEETCQANEYVFDIHGNFLKEEG